ncbi:MAG: hypothetical protein U9R11_04715 [Chloroflexota bacterium]|nr:hypothetical protein [Chloroflexota bacterium]
MNRAAERAKSLLFEPGHTLSQRVVRSGFWVFALRVFGERGDRRGGSGYREEEVKRYGHGGSYA